MKASRSVSFIAKMFSLSVFVLIISIHFNKAPPSSNKCQSHILSRTPIQSSWKAVKKVDFSDRKEKFQIVFRLAWNQPVNKSFYSFIKKTFSMRNFLSAALASCFALLTCWCIYFLFWGRKCRKTKSLWHAASLIFQALRKIWKAKSEIFRFEFQKSQSKVSEKRQMSN